MTPLEALARLLPLLPGTDRAKAALLGVPGPLGPGSTQHDRSDNMDTTTLTAQERDDRMTVQDSDGGRWWPTDAGQNVIDASEDPEGVEMDPQYIEVARKAIATLAELSVDQSL